jgi:ribose 5-phosphate isomerase A
VARDQQVASSPSPRDEPAIEAQKQAAAEAAALLVEDGMRVGLGTGTTAAYLFPALARRSLSHIRCVPSSPATEAAASALGLPLASLEELGGELEIAIDGADQIDPRGWLVKGRGGAQAREKILAAAAKRFVVIASAEKAVDELGPPVPLEVMRFGAPYTLGALSPSRLRDVGPSPDGNLIADYFGTFDDPGALATRISATPGVVAHGLFEPALVSDVLIAGPDGVSHRVIAGG